MYELSHHVLITKMSKAYLSNSDKKKGSIFTPHKIVNHSTSDLDI